MQCGQDVGQEEVSQARVPGSALQLGRFPNTTSRQAEVRQPSSGETQHRQRLAEELIFKFLTIYGSLSVWAVKQSENVIRYICVNNKNKEAVRSFWKVTPLKPSDIDISRVALVMYNVYFFFLFFIFYFTNIWYVNIFQLLLSDTSISPYRYLQWWDKHIIANSYCDVLQDGVS